MTVLITLTTAGTDTGPFNLFSNANGFTSAFETNVSRAALLAGYTSSLVPNFTTVVRVMSQGVCKNYTDIVITTTTTSTTAIPLLVGRRATIPLSPGDDLAIDYTDTSDNEIKGQLIPAQKDPSTYYLCIKCGTTITVVLGTPSGPITYDDGGLVECNCA